MAIQGLRDTSGFTVTGQRPENWREGTMLLFPNGMTPLTALTSVMRSEKTDDPKFHWFEKIMADQRVALTTTISSSVTTLLFSGGGANQFKDGTLLYSEHSKEIVRVTAVASDTSITVVRGWSGTSGAVITVGTHNPNFIVIGSAYEEGSSTPTGIRLSSSTTLRSTGIPWR
ncbi:hypothetical protein LCGC14_2277910 [marine sediment metagenome]|uniref:Uncharacterized protein n=1 Tax=marine sediment metagenome TaxID=412755 RepID=A0A0F9CUY4_9ZZZZ